MTDLWPFIIAGIATGSVYGIAATGLVLTYKTSGIFNFAHGALAAASAYAFYELHFKHGLPWPLATLLCVGVFGPLAGFCVEYFFRRLASATSAMRIVGSIGLLLVIQGAAQVRARVPDAVLIFLRPPSRTELIRRLEARGTERGADLERRLARVDEEMAQADWFDEVVVNDVVDRAVGEVAAILGRYGHQTGSQR